MCVFCLLVVVFIDVVSSLVLYFVNAFFPAVFALIGVTPEFGSCAVSLSTCTQCVESVT